MRKLAETCEAVAATTKKLQKTATVADYLKSRATEEAAVSAVFLSGRAFPAWAETTLQVGGSLLWRVIAELSGKDEAELTVAYRKHGDLGAVAGEVLAEGPGQGLNVLEVARRFPTDRGGARAGGEGCAGPRFAGPGDAARSQIHCEDHDGGFADWAEGKSGRGGDCQSIWWHARGGEEVQRANMLLGDIGETLRRAAEGKLAEAKMRMFHPLGFMLASPIESAEEGLSYFADAAVEDKYDGIRAQAHVSGGEVKFFSRTRDEITESFPELPDALAGLPQDAILDGEIVAWEYPGRARPFSVLQQRLGRKKVSETMLARDTCGVLGLRCSLCGRGVVD